MAHAFCDINLVDFGYGAKHSGYSKGYHPGYGYDGRLGKGYYGHGRRYDGHLGYAGDYY